MPGIDYSRFNNLDASDSEEENAGGKKEEEQEKDRSMLQELPPELSPELSLVLAARHGQQHIVQALLDNRAQVDAADPHGGTALMRAVEGGIENRSVIELLLKRRASVDRPSESGETPLGRAASSGPVELCSALFEADTNPNETTCAQALAAAAVAGNRATSELLVSMKASPCMAAQGRLPLNSWAAHGDTHIMGLLLKHGASVNACDEKGTPLMCAVRAGSLAAAVWLSDKGAEVDAVGEDGRSALLEAVECSNESVASGLAGKLLELGACANGPYIFGSGPRATSPLIAATLAGRASVGKVLLDANADPRAADNTGRRPLTCAAVLGSAAFCKLLLECRAEVNERGTSGTKYESGGGVTALSVAAAAGDTSLAKLLFDAGADVELADERDFRPLMSAARGSNTAMCAVLLDARAEVNARQVETEKTALLLAAGVGSVEACTALIEARADVEAKATTGTAALHAAAGNGHEAVCRLLVASGASLRTAGPGGQDAVGVARLAGQTALTEVLAGMSSSA